MGGGKRNTVGRELKDIFNEWELRICILVSLFLQILLILAGPLRKIVSHKFLDILLWSAYLLADVTAIFSVGLISSRQSDYSNHCVNAVTNNMLLPLWAPFLLAHLGGPDPITAFALEDNELWLRHLFSLFTQCIAVAYVFYQSLTPKLWIATLLMFLCGIIKYAERTYALYCASANTFRDSMLREPDPGPNYAKLMGEYISKKDAKLPTRIEMLPEPDRVIKAASRTKDDVLKPLELVQYAFRYFTNFKGLVVDLIFSFRERNQSRDFFLARTPSDAFRVVEVELNFLYDVLFTKLPVVYYRFGFCCRAVSVGAIVTSLVLFHYVDKKQFHAQGFEIGITYTLLIGGIVLEVIAFFMLVFSDWTVVKLKPSPDENPNENSWKSMFIKFIVNANIRKGKIVCWLLNTGGVRGNSSSNRRWAESISRFNFIYYCLHRRSKAREKIYDQFGIRAFLDEMVYVTRRPVPPNIKDFVFKELKFKSEMADDLDTAKEICSAKGEWVLRIEGHSSSDLFSYVADVDYDESLLLWHIATEIFYNDNENQEEIAKMKKVQSEQDRPQAPGDDSEERHREIAKLISDYMIYLLAMKPGMMSAVSGIGLIRFRDTCAEANKFFDSELSTREKLHPEKKLQETACKKILSVNTEVKPVTIKGDRSKSVLFEAARLAKVLQKLECKNKWVIISKVWVELLSYGASHIRSNAHAQQLSKGGELISVVWLLMAQLGLGDQFQINEGHARAKLIVGK